MMKKLELKHLENIKGGSWGSMCFWSVPNLIFRANLVLYIPTDIALINACWND